MSRSRWMTSGPRSVRRRPEAELVVQLLHVDVAIALGRVHSQLREDIVFRHRVGGRHKVDGHPRADGVHLGVAGIEALVVEVLQLPIRFACAAAKENDHREPDQDQRPLHGFFLRQTHAGPSATVRAGAAATCPHPAAPGHAASVQMFCRIFRRLFCVCPKTIRHALDMTVHPRPAGDEGGVLGTRAPPVLEPKGDPGGFSRTIRVNRPEPSRAAEGSRTRRSGPPRPSGSRSPQGSSPLDASRCRGPRARSPARSTH